MPALTVEEVHDEQQGNGAQPVIQEPDDEGICSRVKLMIY